MKFLHLVTFASVALAVPNPVARQDSVVGTINSAVKTLEGTAQSNIKTLTSGLDAFKGSVDPNAVNQVQDTVKKAFSAIAAELKKATDSIVSVTTKAAGGVAGAAQSFGQAEVDQLVESIKTASKVVADVKGALERAAKELTPEIKKAVEAEIGAAQKAIGPFVDPLTVLVDATKRVVGVKDVDTSELDKVTGQLKKNLQGIIDLVGLPGVNVGAGLGASIGTM